MNELVDESVACIATAYHEGKEAELRAREEDLATTLDSIGDAVVVTDSEGRVVRMNPVAERLMGVDRSECLGRPLDERFHLEKEDTGELVENPVTRVLREGVTVGLANHTALVASDGTRRPIADSGAPVRRENGELRGVVLVFRDVSEERRAEESLRHWERVFQHATWGVALASVDDVRFRAVNPAYAEMHGYTVEELMGLPVSVLWTPETRADMELHAKTTHEHGHLVAETIHRRKDGSTLPVEVIATTIKDARGHISWFVANVQDITERKRLQHSRDRAIELEAENRRMEEANRLKSEFLANMSHELRTPLNSIIGFAELLVDEQVGEMEPQQKEFLGDILSGGRHLLRLINDVLDLAKVEAGKMEFRAEPVDLPELVGAVVQSLSVIAAAKDLDVRIQVSPELTAVVIDPDRLRQILFNYLSNALKFTPERGRIEIRLGPEGRTDFRIEVQDTGIGVPVESVPELFKAFNQLDAGDAKRHGGTGLGLALTKRLAEAQGGVVGTQPAPDGGSIFFAVLPRRPNDYEAPVERRDVPAHKSVLVIESDPRDRALLLQILTDAEYDADAVADCADAVVAWEKRAYDAVTLDLFLQDDCSQRLLELVRNDSRKPAVAVIGMTVVADPAGAADLAVSDLLMKPVAAPALLHALEANGLPPARGRLVLVVDDDPGSLKLMEVTLAKLGYTALCFSDPRDALDALPHIRPIAVVVDLLMPRMDGVTFVHRFRAVAKNGNIPVMFWTVKDLSAEERQQLSTAVSAVMQKGRENGSRLSAALQTLLPPALQPEASAR